MSANIQTDPSSHETVAPEATPARKQGRVERFWRLYGLAALFTLFMLVLWEVIIRGFNVPKYLFPAPSQVAIAMRDDWSSILGPAMWVTLREVLIGFVIAAVTGVGLAVLLHLFGPLRRAMYPLLIGSQTVPIVVLAPILVILLGYGIAPKLVIVALICFFPIVVNGLDGLRSVDEDFIHMMRTLDANRWAIFKRIEFPAALPAIFSGMRIAATFASIGAIFGEWSGASSGLGFRINEAQRFFESDTVIGYLLLLGLLGLVTDQGMKALSRLFFGWSKARA